MIDNLNRPFDLNLDSILKYQHSSFQSVTETNNNTLKEFRLFEQLFEKESKEAFENFKTIYNTTKEFNNLVSDGKKTLDPIIDAKNSLDLIKEDVGNIEKKKEEIDDYNKRLSDLSIELKSEQDRLKELESSNEMESFNQMMKKKGELESQLSDTKSVIIQNFSNVDKPLRKFQHLVQRGIEKIDDEKILDKLIDSPVNTIIGTKDFKQVNSLLEKIKHSINSGVMEIKDRDKILSEIEWLVGHSIFEELANKYDSVLEEVKKLEKDISEQDVLKSMNAIKNHIDQLNRESQTKTEDIERMKKQIEKLNVSIKENGEKMEKTLSEFIGRKVTINLPSNI